jgi:magnesium transporter
MKRASKKAGLPPGTLVHIGEKKTERVRITLIEYNEKIFREKEIKNLDEWIPSENEPTVTWINIDGLHDVEVIEKVGKHFNLHPLTMEDVLNTGQRPKTDDFDDYTYVVFKMLLYEEKEQEVRSEQVSLVIGLDFIISFQENEGDVFDSVRNRIRNGKGQIRGLSSDYLAYTLMDAVVDHYFLILETLGEKIESLEDEILENPTPQALETIHEMRREMIYLRKQVWPMREIVSRLEKGVSPFIRKSTGMYLKDIYDHTIQVMDTIESFRDILAGLLDIYLSTISNKMNEVMKVLTIIATLFIPITFVAGVYGMNFKNMPELDWRFGYLVTWMVMIIVAVIMLLFFKKKRWL